MAKVDPYSCWDGVVNGAGGDDELENILSILDFPMESLEGDGFVGDWDVSNSQHLGPIPSDVLMRPAMADRSKVKTGPPVLWHRQVAPIDATSEPKHLSSCYEETSGSCIRRQNKSNEVQEQERGVFESQSPVSVLENSGSSSAGMNLFTKSHVNKRTRSKRARPSVNPWLLMSPLFSTTSTIEKTSNARKIREKRTKMSHLSVSKKTIEDSSNIVSDYAELQTAASKFSAITKKCTHCEVTKTPQWREGPLGLKTLCNACGVRYRSGRLFPEYRPAVSPTFVPSLHSNSHKKVVEMRTKAKQQEVNKIQEPSMPP